MAEKDFFYCDDFGMNQLTQKVSAIRSVMEGTNNEAKKILSEIKSKELWMGAARQTMEAYMELVVQYHNKMIEPQRLDAMLSEWNNFIQEFEEIYDDWSEWNKLNSI